MADQSFKTTYTDDSGCFVCGDRNPIGLHAEFTFVPQELRCYALVKLTVEFQGWQDVVHGGILAALLDEACVNACRSVVDQCVTAEIQVRYRKPVPVGSTVQVSGQVLSRKRRIWTAASRLTIGEDCYAEAEAKVFVFSRKKESKGTDSQIDSSA